MTNTKFPDLILTKAPVTITEGSGIENMNSQIFQIYPNPVTDIMHISLPQAEVISKIRIYSANGKELLFFNNLSSPVEIDMGNFSSGIYILKVITSETNIQEQIIKW